jgi:hypothetical protein
MKEQSGFDSDPAVLVTVWGDGRCSELDRFVEPGDSNSDPDLPAEIKADFDTWWETADEPWCLQVVAASKDVEDDLVTTCDRAPAVVSYHISEN